MNVLLFLKSAKHRSRRDAYVEFVLAPQHETSCDPETTAKEDFAYWKRITEESNLEVYRRIHDKSNEPED